MLSLGRAAQRVGESGRREGRRLRGVFLSEGRVDRRADQSQEGEGGGAMAAQIRS